MICGVYVLIRMQVQLCMYLTLKSILMMLFMNVWNAHSDLLYNECDYRCSRNSNNIATRSTPIIVPTVNIDM